MLLFLNTSGCTYANNAETQLSFTKLRRPKVDNLIKILILVVVWLEIEEYQIVRIESYDNLLLSLILYQQ